MKRKTVAALKVGTAAVWLVFGLGFKAFDLVPRHRLIVAAIVGAVAAFLAVGWYCASHVAIAREAA